GLYRVRSRILAARRIGHRVQRGKQRKDRASKYGFVIVPWCQTRTRAEGRAFHVLRIAVISVLLSDGERPGRSPGAPGPDHSAWCCGRWLERVWGHRQRRRLSPALIRYL